MSQNNTQDKINSLITDLINKISVIRPEHFAAFKSVQDGSTQGSKQHFILGVEVGIAAAIRHLESAKRDINQG